MLVCCEKLKPGIESSSSDSVLASEAAISSLEMTYVCTGASESLCSVFVPVTTIGFIISGPGLAACSGVVSALAELAMSNDKINPQIMFLFAFIFAPVCLLYIRGLFLTSGRPCANSGRSFLDVFQILPETKPFLLNFLCKNGPYIPSFLLSLPCSLRRAFSPFQRIGVCSRTQTLTHRGSL